MVAVNSKSLAFASSFFGGKPLVIGLLTCSEFPSQRLQRSTSVARRASIARDFRNKDTPHASLAGNIEDLPLERVPEDLYAIPEHWRRPGLYGIYAKDGVLQYVAAVEDVARAIEIHIDVIKDPARVYAVRMITLNHVEEAPIGEMAENWVMALDKSGLPVPPGNTDDAPEWRVERAPRNASFSPSARSDTSDSHVDEEIRSLLRTHRVVLFIKGTRETPRCGFSQAVIEMVEKQLGNEFVCIDCLDSIKNPGLREGIKRFSNWPTIPQLYVNGDFVGGCDIVQGMEASGELSSVLRT